MVVIIGKIPGGTTKNALAEFVNLGLKRGFFKSHGEITDINNLQLSNNDPENSEFYGLVTIEPDVAAERAIKKLNGLLFNGTRVNVRQYRIRNNSVRLYHERRRNFKVNVHY